MTQNHNSTDIISVLSFDFDSSLVLLKYQSSFSYAD